MIVRDEAEHLEGALASVAALVKEMIVVDTGSRDDTREIALAGGAKLFEREWEDDFAAARNAALAEASGDFILILDADERIAERDHRVIRAAVVAEPPRAYRFTQLNYSNNSATVNWRPCIGNYREAEGFAGFVEAEQVRLFPNDPKLRYTRAVHETILPACAEAKLPVETLPVFVHHYGRAKSAEHLLGKARLYLELGRKKVAEDEADRKGTFELGAQLLELHLNEEAREVFERVLAGDPGHRDAQNMLGVACTALGDLERANAVLRSVVTSHPEFSDAWNNFGVVQIRNGDAAAACDSFERAVALDAGNANALANLGSAENELGQSEAALAHVGEAARIDPHSAGHRLRRVMILVKSGEEEDARAELEKIASGGLHFDPANVRQWCVLSTLLDIASEHVDFIESKLDSMPVDLAVAIELVAHFEAKGQNTLAESLLERIVAAHPDCTIALDSLGCHLARQGRHAEALIHFIRVIEINPTNVGTLRNVALLCEEMGATKPALDFYKHLAACDPDSVEYVRERLLGMKSSVAASRGN
jgi:tetratricopeptide (TPR) repeat protein